MFNNRCHSGYGTMSTASVKSTKSFLFRRNLTFCDLDDRWGSRIFGLNDYSYLNDCCKSSVFIFHQIVRM